MLNDSSENDHGPDGYDGKDNLPVERPYWAIPAVEKTAFDDVMA